MSENNRQTKLDSIFNFSQSLQLVILAFILVLVSAVLIKVYGMTISMSEKAKDLSICTYICENISEEFRSDSSKYSDGDVLFFDSDGNISAEEKASYMVLLNIGEEKTDDSRLLTLDITAMKNEDVIYSLSSKMYDWGNGL